MGPPVAQEKFSALHTLPEAVYNSINLKCTCESKLETTSGQNYKNKIDLLLKCMLFAVGIVSAAVLFYAVWSIFKTPSVARTLIPRDVAVASRTLAQTFQEKKPVAGETSGKLTEVPRESLALELLMRPNSDVYLSFSADFMRPKNVIAVPYPHFESVEMRPVTCGEKPFNAPQDRWQKLSGYQNGSFFFEVTSPLKCFELRLAGICTKNVRVEFFDSISAMEGARKFEVSAVQVPYFSFIAVILISSIIALAITKDNVLPMYICYVLTISGFSFFIDGNGYVFIKGLSKAMSIFGYGSAGIFSVSMVAWMWLKILGKSRLFFVVFWISFLSNLIGPVFLSEAVVRIVNIIVISCGIIMIIGGAFKVVASLKDKVRRSNAIYMFLGLFLFNICACIWVLQHLSFIESTLWTRSSVKIGFIFESSFFMWAISNSYRNRIESTKHDLVQDKIQYFEAAQRFVPHFLLEILGKDDIRNINVGSTVELTGTIVCIDIKGFTQWSENRHPDEILFETNKAWGTLIPEVHKNKGAVASFTGDGLVLLFPKNPIDALTFLISTMNRKKNDPTFIADFEFGMGVHYGSIMFGAVGQKTQMCLTVLSNIVNTAARIESVTRDTQSMIVASASFVKACGIDKKSTLQILPKGYAQLNSESVFFDVGMRFLGSRLFKGKRTAMELFDISFVNNTDDYKRIVDFINKNEISKKSMGGNKEMLANGLSEAEKVCPVLTHYIKYSENLTANRRPAVWKA